MIDTDHRYRARELRELGEGMRIKGNTRTRGIITGSPPPTLAKENDRHTKPQGQLKHPVLLVMVTSALGACQNRIIIVHHHGPRGFIAQQIRIDRACASHHTVARGALAKGFDVLTLMLTRNNQRPVFFKGAFIH